MIDSTPQMQIPDGYVLGPNGSLVPKANVKPMDQLKDELVKNAVTIAKQLQESMRAFKRAQTKAVDDLNALMEQEFNTNLGGKKGNAVIRSFDQTQAIRVQILDRIELGPELAHAKAKIDELLDEWMLGSNANLCKIIQKKFQPDKQGNISVKDILSNKSLEIEDDSGRWAEAMRIIDESINIIGSTRFIRFYERGDDGIERQISLDIAKL